MYPSTKSESPYLGISRALAGNARGGSRGRWMLGVVLAAAACSLAGGAQGQATGAGGTGRSPTAGGVVTFSPDQYRVESIGLAMMLPEGATTQLSRDAGKTTARILAPDQSWIINIESRETTNQTMSLSEVATAIQDQILASVGVQNADGKLVSTRGKVLSRSPGLQLKGGMAERVYVSTPTVGAPSTVRGYTIFNPSAGRFVTFELLTPEQGYSAAAPVYEAIVATVEFEDPSVINAVRQQAIAAGQSLFSQLTTEDYRAVIGQKGVQRWQRLYEASSTGTDDTEIGYRRIESWLGHRGEMDPTRERARWSRADHESGYMLRMEARILDGKAIYDTVSLFFLSEDRSDEAWLVRGSRKDDSGTQTWTETGARSGKSMTVRIDSPGSPSRTLKPLIEGEGYLSRLESLLLPDFLMRKRITTEYGFYVYQSDAETIRMRRDVLGESEARAGLFTITTKLSEEAPAQTSYFNERGEMIRIELPGSRVWEPIELNRLVQTWRRKNLPMD